MARFVPNFDEFNAMTLFGICRQFTENIPATIAWCGQNGLLAQMMSSERCHVGAFNRCQDGSLDCGQRRGLSQKQVLKELEIKGEHKVVDSKQFCAMSEWSIFLTICNRLTDLAALWKWMRACSPRGNTIVAEFFLKTGYLEDMTWSTKKGSRFQFLEGIL
eukprot:gene14996-6149_t